MIKYYSTLYLISYFVDPMSFFIFCSIFFSTIGPDDDNRDFLPEDLCPVLCDMPALFRLRLPLPFTRNLFPALVLALRFRLIPMNRFSRRMWGGCGSCGLLAKTILAMMGLKMDNNDDGNILYIVCLFATLYVCKLGDIYCSDPELIEVTKEQESVER